MIWDKFKIYYNNFENIKWTLKQNYIWVIAKKFKKKFRIIQ